MNLNSCRFINIDTFSNNMGNLSIVESNKNIPFKLERIYYLHGIPSTVERGVHAHKKLQQLIIAISGSFDITLDDGKNKITYHMNDPKKGLYICPMIWREINNFSNNAVLMVLASTKYEEDDYIHNYDDFIQYKENTV